MMNAINQVSIEQKKKIEGLLKDTQNANSLAPVDLKQFWVDQEEGLKDPFGANISQVPLGAVCNWECVFDELAIEQDHWKYLYENPQWALKINKSYNDLSEEIVGKRLLSEKPVDPLRVWPRVKELYEIFEAENVWLGGKSGSWWLKQSAFDSEGLSALLDRVEKRLENLKDFILPEDWEIEKTRLTSLGESVPLYRYQRGPCTFACSIYGVENMMFLYFDNPSLMTRFSQLIAAAIVERARILDEEAGFTQNNSPRGWHWYDDNSYLFNPEMFEHFAMPIHRRVFGTYSPGKGDTRYQHSDSNMAHLLPLLRELDLSGTNFGPTLSVSEIREHCPNAVIEGQLAPFTFSRNESENLVAEFLRDFDQAQPERGLLFATAGSINNGSSLKSMRLLMAAIQRYGRY